MTDLGLCLLGGHGLDGEWVGASWMKNEFGPLFFENSSRQLVVMKEHLKDWRVEQLHMLSLYLILQDFGTLLRIMYSSLLAYVLLLSDLA